MRPDPDRSNPPPPGSVGGGGDVLSDALGDDLLDLDAGKTAPASPTGGLASMSFMNLYVRIDRAEPSRFRPLRNRAAAGGNLRLPPEHEPEVEALRKALRSAPDDEFFILHDGMRLRCARKRTATGAVRCSLRRVPPEVRAFGDLGIDPQKAAFLLGAGKGNGLLVASGGAGQGKSTTCASLMVELLRLYGGTGYTLERPIEFDMEREWSPNSFCYQVEIEDEAAWEREFQICLRWLATHVLFGEVRTSACAAQVLEAANAGLFVLCSVHGDTIEQALHRLIQLAQPIHGARARTMLAEGLAGVINQSLVEDGATVRPEMQMLFAEQNSVGDPVRAALREDRLQTLGTLIEQQSNIMKKAAMQNPVPIDFFEFRRRRRL